jgi:hypothetical protein
MFRRINELSFVIGLFFTMVAIILIGGFMISVTMFSKANLYTGIVFLVFGLAMMLIRSGPKNDVRK